MNTIPVCSWCCLCQVSAVTKYQLCEQTFSQFFPDDSPLVSVSSAAKGGGWSSPGQVRIKQTSLGGGWLRGDPI